MLSTEPASCGLPHFLEAFFHMAQGYFHPAHSTQNAEAVPSPGRSVYSDIPKGGYLPYQKDDKAVDSRTIRNTSAHDEASANRVFNAPR